MRFAWSRRVGRKAVYWGLTYSRLSISALVEEFGGLSGAVRRCPGVWWRLFDICMTMINARKNVFLELEKKDRENRKSPPAEVWYVSAEIPCQCHGVVIDVLTDAQHKALDAPHWRPHQLAPAAWFRLGKTLSPGLVREILLPGIKRDGITSFPLHPYFQTHAHATGEKVIKR